MKIEDAIKTAHLLRNRLHSVGNTHDAEAVGMLIDTLLSPVWRSPTTLPEWRDPTPIDEDWLRTFAHSRETQQYSTSIDARVFFRQKKDGTWEVHVEEGVVKNCTTRGDVRLLFMALKYEQIP